VPVRPMTGEDLFRAVVALSPPLAIPDGSAIRAWCDQQRPAIQYHGQGTHRGGKHFLEADISEGPRRLQKWKKDCSNQRSPVGWSMSRQQDPNAFGRAQEWARKHGWTRLVWDGAKGRCP
jgi:hypothetical protein